MGLLSKRWEAEFEGHVIAVERGWTTHGYKLLIDEETVDEVWADINMGIRELKGSLVHENTEHSLFVLCRVGAITEKLTITVDDRELPVKKVKKKRG